MTEANGESLNAEAGPPGKRERGKAVKLVDRVFDQLLERIRGGNYPPDSRLPGEHELASMLGVSRPIVRDALARLRDQGIVYARQGPAPSSARMGRRQPSLPIRLSRPLPISSAATNSA